MDIPAASAGPWIVLGTVLGILLIAAIGALAVRPSRDRSQPHSPDHDRGAVVDDLPGFLAAPPGTRGRDRPAEGWVALSAPMPTPASTAPPPAAREWSPTGRALAAMLVSALVLVGAAAAVAGGSQGGDSASPQLPADGGAEPVQAGAQLVFGGVVLERRAVGVTVSYPRVVLDGTGAGAHATVELPTFNCLSAVAPADPFAAGCTRIWTEYAELSAPALAVLRDGDRLQFSGRFATWLRPNGSPPVATGRAYELMITAAPTGPRAADGWMPADGMLRVGEDRAPTIDGEAELRYPR